MKISVNDVEIDLVTCGHCKAVPTEAEAQAALKHEDGCRPKCAVCGEKIKLSEMKLTHHYYGDEHRWMIDGKVEQFVDVSHYGVGCWVRATMHVSCFQKVAPGATVTPH